MFQARTPGSFFQTSCCVTQGVLPDSTGKASSVEERETIYVSGRHVFSNTDDVLAVILGGGRGMRLYPLTAVRSKPAVPFGGKYRLIDIPISNCINSGITRIFVLTQFNSASLNRHVSRTYQFSSFIKGFVDILAAQQTIESSDWYQGTADAVRQNMHAIRSRPHSQIMILSGDHLYRMDYRYFLRAHVEQRADISIGVCPVTRDDASGYGIMRVGRDDRITEFHEKPADPHVLDRLAVKSGDPAKPYLASMGIYIFNPDVLEKALADTAQTDFGREIIPASIKRFRVTAYPFSGYWRDIGTIRSFYEANLEMVTPLPPFNFYNTRHPIYTRPRFLPASKINSSIVERCLLADGCIVTRADLRNSVVGLRTIIRANSRILESVILGADYYEQEFSESAAVSSQRQEDPVGMGIGRNVHIERAIIDKNARIGDNVTIINARGHKDFDGPGFVVRDGLVIVPKNTVIKPGTII